jgi:hypothetical protein
MSTDTYIDVADIDDSLDDGQSSNTIRIGHIGLLGNYYETNYREFLSVLAILKPIVDKSVAEIAGLALVRAVADMERYSTYNDEYMAHFGGMPKRDCDGSWDIAVLVSLVRIFQNAHRVQLKRDALASVYFVWHVYLSTFTGITQGVRIAIVSVAAWAIPVNWPAVLALWYSFYAHVFTCIHLPKPLRPQ